MQQPARMESARGEVGAALLAAIVDSSSEAIAACDSEGTISTWNPAAADLWGWAPEEIVGQPLSVLFAPHEHDHVGGHLAQVLRGGRLARHGVEGQRADGAPLQLALTLAPLRGADGRPVGCCCLVADLTPRMHADQRLAAAEGRFEAIFDQSAVGMVVADHRGHPTAVNAAAARMLGRSAESLVGGPWAPMGPPGEAGPPLPGLGAVAGGDGSYSGEHRFVRPDGGVVWVQVDASVIHGAADGAAHLLYHLQDVSARKEAERELLHRVLHDDLTGLPNRTLLADRLEQSLGRGGAGTRTGVVFVDLSGFKHVNDVLGHHAGDRVLSEAAARLTGLVGQADTVARFGGDEFVVVCHDTDVDRLATFTERLADALEEPLDLDGRAVPLLACLGVTISRAGSTAGSLLSEADAAMYRAKELGRGQAAVFDESMRARAAALLEGESALREALVSGRIAPWYQPIVELATGATVGMEALARWEQPDGTVRAAAEWIDLAEQGGLIGRLGATMLARAAADAAGWAEGAGGPWVSVNVDAAQLIGGGLPDLVGEVLAASGLHPSRLRLEVTETAVMADLERSLQVLADLRALGVHLSIDDFGTGYSSLSYLARLPVDTLKIDRSFVAALAGDGVGAPIVQAVVALCAALGLRCVAEGVESDDQRDTLEALHCDDGQGYLWSRPLPACAVSDWLAGRRAG